MSIQINGTTGISGVDGTAGSPALQGTDTNTGISFGTDEVSINTAGTTGVKVDANHNVTLESPGEGLHTIKRTGAVANNDYIGNITWRAENSVGTVKEYSKLFTQVTNTASGSETAVASISTAQSGTIGVTCARFFDSQTHTDHPYCRVTLANGWQDWTIPATLGVSNGGFSVNYGGKFWIGGTLPQGYYALHVPYTGQYLIISHVYRAAAADQRLSVNVNASYSAGIMHEFCPVSGDSTTSLSSVIHLNQGDFLNYGTSYNVPAGAGNMYHDSDHTDLSVYFLG